MSRFNLESLISGDELSRVAVEASSSPGVADLARQICVQLRDELSQIQQLRAGDPEWQADLAAIEMAIQKLEGFASSSQEGRLPALNELMGLLGRMGDPTFAESLRVWTAKVSSL